MKEPACCACRHQRRKCTADCPLAPFFPPDKAEDFEAAHKLFGVNNIVKNLRNLNPAQRPEAVTSIVYEANARARDPVGGCSSIITKLMHRINSVKMELDLVRNRTAYFRALLQQQQQQQHQANLFDHNFNTYSLDFLQEPTNARGNLDQSLNRDFNILQGNVENPQQHQEYSFVQENKQLGGDLSVGRPLPVPQQQRQLRQDQEPGFFQGGNDSKVRDGNSVTNLTIGGQHGHQTAQQMVPLQDRNVFGRGVVKADRGQSSSSSIVHGKPLVEDEDEDVTEDNFGGFDQ